MDSLTIAKMGAVVVTGYIAVEGFKILGKVAMDAWKNRNGKERTIKEPARSPTLTECMEHRGQILREVSQGFDKIDTKLDKVMDAQREQWQRHEDRYHPVE